MPSSLGQATAQRLPQVSDAVEEDPVQPSWLKVTGAYALAPVQLGVALMANLHRIRNLRETLRRRLT
ncbi:MAG: hypothetical protein AAFV01_15080 [Bacteroidota bacterium]